MWRRTFDTAEHLTATQLDRLMRTELFAHALAATVNSTTFVRRRFDAATARWLRLFNVASRADVHHLQEILLTLERRTRDIDRRLEAAVDDPAGQASDTVPGTAR